MRQVRARPPDRPAGFTADSLSLVCFNFLDTASKVTAFFCALAGHPTLETIELQDNDVHAPHSYNHIHAPLDDIDLTAIGEALRLLVSTPSPLRFLCIGGYKYPLKPGVLLPLFRAVERSTTLRRLTIFIWDSEEDDDDFAAAAERVLAAVQANTSLRELLLDSKHPVLKQAEELVAARPRVPE